MCGLGLALMGVVAEMCKAVSVVVLRMGGLIGVGAFGKDVGNVVGGIAVGCGDVESAVGMEGVEGVDIVVCKGVGNALVEVSVGMVWLLEQEMEVSWVLR